MNICIQMLGNANLPPCKQTARKLIKNVIGGECRKPPKARFYSSNEPDVFIGAPEVWKGSGKLIPLKTQSGRSKTQIHRYTRKTYGGNPDWEIN